MKITEMNKKENKLASRTEVNASFVFTGATPSRKQIRAALSKELKVKEDMVIVKHIGTKFGFQQGTLVAHAYSDKAFLEKFEPKYMLDRNTEKKKEDKPAKAPKQAAAKEEAPKAGEKAETKDAPKAKPEAPKESKEKALKEEPAKEEKQEKK